MTTEAHEDTILRLIVAETKRCGHKLDVTIHGYNGPSFGALHVSLSYKLNARVARLRRITGFLTSVALGLVISSAVSAGFFHDDLFQALFCGGVFYLAALTHSMALNLPATTAQQWSQHIDGFLAQRGYAIDRDDATNTTTVAILR